MKLLNKKKILITGAGGVLGISHAKTFLHHGAELILSEIKGSRLKLIKKEYQKNPSVKIYDHDVDENPNFGTDLGTRGLPTFYCYVNGELKGQLVGAVPESKLAEFVTQHSS